MYNMVDGIWECNCGSLNSKTMEVCGCGLKKSEVE
tara:strand:+ start:165 stop:269 length:105 start_codon:yes stop_codon:yes gene_type:complete